MKKIIGVIFTLVALSSFSTVFAEDAEITYVKGKVEVQRNSQWIALKPGDKVAKSEMISTGFQSEAKVKLLDSVMSLGPVTRITLEELTSGNNTDKVNVYLKTGSVRSQVNHTESKRVNYQVHTAIAVASARGTDYCVFDSNETYVTEGVVAVSNYKGLTDDSADLNEQSDKNCVFVQANQSVVVTSENSQISAPVSNSIKAMNNVVSSVSSAADKEGVSSGAGSSFTKVTSNAVNNSNSSIENNPIPEVQEPVGSINISITIK